MGECCQSRCWSCLGCGGTARRFLLAVKNMGGETEAAWRHVLEDLLGRGLKAPGASDRRRRQGPGGGAGQPVERYSGAALHGAQGAQPPRPCAEGVARRGQGRLHRHDVRRKRRASAQEAQGLPGQVGGSAAGAWRTAWKRRGERLFTFLRYPPQQWKSLRTTNAIERLHGEFKRRVKTQCALPNAETAAMLFWALMASGQITMRRVGGWQTLDQAPVKKPIDLAA